MMTLIITELALINEYSSAMTVLVTEEARLCELENISGPMVMFYPSESY